MYAKVKDQQNLVRDLHTNAILNVDSGALKKHEKIMLERAKEAMVQQQINSLKDDISEIKEMLRSLTK